MTRTRRNRGATLVAVLISFTLVAAAVTALAVLFAAEAKRTRATLEGAQLRQLLLAAPPATVEELKRNGTDTRDVPVPTPVPNTTLTLHIQSTANDVAEVHVTAKSPRASATQTLRYARAADAWKLQSATLGPQP